MMQFEGRRSTVKSVFQTFLYILKVFLCEEKFLSIELSRNGADILGVAAGYT